MSASMVSYSEKGGRCSSASCFSLLQGEGPDEEYEISFEYRKQRFVYNIELNRFEKLKFPTRVGIVQRLALLVPLLCTWTALFCATELNEQFEGRLARQRLPLALEQHHVALLHMQGCH